MFNAFEVRMLREASALIGVAQRELRSLRVSVAWKRFNPNQPRVPAGNPDGGQWTSDGGSSGGARIIQISRGRRPSGSSVPTLTITVMGRPETVPVPLAMLHRQTELQYIRTINEARRYEPSYNPPSGMYQGVRGQIQHFQYGINHANGVIARYNRDFLRPQPTSSIITSGGNYVGYNKPGSRSNIYTVTFAQFQGMQFSLGLGSRVLPQRGSFQGTMFFRRVDNSTWGLRFSPKSGVTIEFPQINRNPMPNMKYHNAEGKSYVFNKKARIPLVLNNFSDKDQKKMSDDYHFFPEALFWKDLEEFKEYILFDLEKDAVCFDGLVTYPRNGLRFFGDALTDALRQCLVCLMEAGAVPAESGIDVGYYWLRIPKYGTGPHEVVDNIIREWLEKGGGVPDPMGLWFVTPDICGPTREEAEQEMREDD